MTYTLEQITVTVDYIAESILDQSVSAGSVNEFKDFLILVLKSMTLDLPSKSRPREIEISKLAYRSLDNPLNAFFHDCNVKGISFPPLFNVVLQRSGVSIDRSAGDSFVVYENNPQLEEDDSYVDPYMFRKMSGRKRHDSLKSDKDCSRLMKPEVAATVQIEAPVAAPVSSKRKDEKEKYFNAQHERANESQVVDRRSKVNVKHPHRPQIFAPAYTQYRQVTASDVLNLAVAFTQIRLSSIPKFHK